MHEVLVNHLGGLSLPRKSVVRLTDRPDMTLDVYLGRKTTTDLSPPSLHLKTFSHLLSYLLKILFHKQHIFIIKYTYIIHT